jgi:pimeloyl-ACP methyl ester carboxylesterase
MKYFVVCKFDIMKRFVYFLKWGIRILVLLVFVAAVCYYKSDIGVDVLRNKYAGASSKFVEVDGMQVHYRDEGVDSLRVPVVLIHGTGSSLQTWDGWVERMVQLMPAGVGKGRRVIRFDLPGFGLTGPNAVGDYSQRYYVGFLKRFLDKMGVGKCVLAGNSLGGEVAWAYSLAYPEGVEKLILVDAAGYPRNSQRLPLGFRLAQTPVLKNVVRYFTPYSVVKSSILDVYGNKSRVTDGLVNRYYELTLRTGNRQAFIDRIGQFVADSSYLKLPSLKTRTLILWGELDMLIPLESGRRFHADLPNDSLVVLKGLGHVPMEEDAAGTVEIVKDFIEKRFIDN